MLKERVITAVILVFIVLGFIFLLSNGYFALVIAAVLLIGAWEWSNFMGLKSLPIRLAYVGSLAVLFWFGFNWPIQWVFGVAVGFWVLGLYWVMNYPGNRQQWNNVPALGLMGALVLYPGWLGVVQLQGVPEFGAWLVLYVIALVAVADSAAYFAGRRYGKKKLAPLVSPGKSIAGLLGGVAAATLVAVGVGFAVELSMLDWLVFLIVSQVTALVSVLGDLLESMVKRSCGVKDSGKILPGHGGILDRVDGYTAAMPVFCFGYFVLGVSV